MHQVSLNEQKLKQVNEHQLQLNKCNAKLEILL